MAANMHHFFYVEYFKGLEVSNAYLESQLSGRNIQIERATFSEAFNVHPFKIWEDLKDNPTLKSTYGSYQTIDLKTTYPGLAIGMGIEHDLSVKGAIKSGFSLDFITGLPHVPGSSLKGLLRSAFRFGKGQEEKKSYLLDLIKEIRPDFQEKDLSKLEESIFEHGDIFLGAFPKKPEVETQQVALLAIDHITPHGDVNDEYGIFKEPNPIPILKVKPDVTFTFAFLLKDSPELLTAEEKKKLFTQILCDFGIGAKTNVGFGQFKRLT